jgi:hypothetical protein
MFTARIFSRLMNIGGNSCVISIFGAEIDAELDKN